MLGREERKSLTSLIESAESASQTTASVDSRTCFGKDLKAFCETLMNENNLIIEKYRTNKMKLSLRVKGAKCWNQLPDNLKSKKSLKLFKTLFKKYILSSSKL